MTMPPPSALIVELLMLAGLAAGARGGYRRWKRGVDASRSNRYTGLAEAAGAAGVVAWLVGSVHFDAHPVTVWAGGGLLVTAVALAGVGRAYVAVERHDENVRRKGFDQSPRRNMGLLGLLVWFGFAYVVVAGFVVISIAVLLTDHVDEDTGFDRVGSGILLGWMAAAAGVYFVIRWRLRKARQREDERVLAEDRGEAVGAPSRVPLRLVVAAWIGLGLLTAMLVFELVVVSADGRYSVGATIAGLVAAIVVAVAALAHVRWRAGR